MPLVIENLAEQQAEACQEQSHWNANELPQQGDQQHRQHQPSSGAEKRRRQGASDRSERFELALQVAPACWCAEGHGWPEAHGLRLEVLGMAGRSLCCG